MLLNIISIIWMTTQKLLAGQRKKTTPTLQHDIGVLENQLLQHTTISLPVKGKNRNSLIQTLCGN